MPVSFTVSSVLRYFFATIYSLSPALFMVYLVLFIIGCEQPSDGILQQLDPAAEYDINVTEPSDVCFGATGDILYTVSDNASKIYALTTKGKIKSEFKVDGSDFEGICFVENKFLYVAQEVARTVIKLDLQGNQVATKLIPVEKNDDNEGLEGIAYASFNNRFYLLNEKNPDVLIETDSNLNVLEYYPLSFADDYSGICVDNSNRNLWVVSDVSASVHKCTMQGEVIESYLIPVKNAEGIAFDPLSNTIYIVSDSKSKLYVFDYGVVGSEK